MKKKIIVAMSGGVDSSVAAALMAKEGHEVIGVTLRLLQRGATGFGCCGSPEDITIAKRSAEKAGIPHYVLDYSADFEKDVIQYFVDSYLDGETPNPCLACNKTIKFDKLKKFAHTLEATHLATGHYAQIKADTLAGSTRYRLFESKDPSKDQSYVLYMANQKSLSTTLFPVGEMPKPEIREIARKLGLPNADKKDSQEICFVPNRDYRTFVHNNVVERKIEFSPTTKPGLIKNLKGEVLGEHKGVAYYTIGQRKGLGLTTLEPHYVIRLEAKTNTVIVGRDTASLCQGLITRDVSWVADAPPDAQFKALVKIRYKHEPAPAMVLVRDTGVDVQFDEPQRAVSPGQAAVVYRWDEKMKAREVLGGGIIHSSVREAAHV